MRLFDEADVSSTRRESSYLLSVSNFRAGTIRGMHFQVDKEVGPKLLTVSSGALIDFAVDIRPQSATYGVAFTAIVRAVEPAVLKIPSGFAHGYQTLEINTTLLYWLDEEVGSGNHLGYNPLSACMRDFWPINDGLTISVKDSNSPEFEFDNLHVQEIPAAVT
jgi:dTDP-4-dehydrorhamnose 3,5-epimerase